MAFCDIRRRVAAHANLSKIAIVASSPNARAMSCIVFISCVSFTNMANLTPVGEGDDARAPIQLAFAHRCGIGKRAWGVGPRVRGTDGWAGPSHPSRHPLSLPRPEAERALQARKTTDSFRISNSHQPPPGLLPFAAAPPHFDTIPISETSLLPADRNWAARPLIPPTKSRTVFVFTWGFSVGFTLRQLCYCRAIIRVSASP
ncbi:hypothetical protein B0H67DRAFT_68870 [Lasiosphaeris hirsuta]|uniref:Uncharacterized protein n=1 Tax=Lasiosphaeris hirsuta TaxID=260670 RepID=A0AA40EDH8_9PEZI|nr:hypothetical protein B0H67DRAFT_68870 [Lasiosphaeris hirsuta]